MLSNEYDLNNLVIRYVVPIVGSIGAAIGTVWLLQAVNPLAALSAFAAGIFLLVSIVSPRSGLFVLMGVCAYSDLVKRMLVMFRELSFDQISYVLMAAPIIVVGLLTSLLTRRAFHMVRLNRADLVLGGIAIFLAVLNFALEIRANSSSLEAIRSAVNHGVFCGVAVVGLRAFRNAEDLEKFLRATLLIFLPVPLYAFWQLAFGYADFEVEYLRSGLTVEIKQLFEIRPRPFSTLNSAGVVGTLCAGFFVIATYPWITRRIRQFRRAESVGSILVATIYFAGAVGSLVRSSHAVWIIALFSLWCFRSAVRTRVFYTAVFVGIVSMIGFAGWIQENLHLIDPARYATSDYGASALSILTYNDRLTGFINLTASTQMYSWFGIPQAQQGFGATYSHDPISGLIMKVGVVGFLMVLVGVISGLRWIHTHILALAPGRGRELAVLLMSLLAGWLCTEVLVNSVITVFPLNALFWLFVGATTFLVTTNQEVPEVEGSREDERADLPDSVWRPRTGERPRTEGVGEPRWNLSHRHDAGDRPRR